MEVVIPIELTVPSGRVENYDKEANAEGLQLNMDLIEEKRERADLHTQVYKQRVARHYDSKVRPRSLGLGDWVMKQVMTQPLDLINMGGTLRDNGGSWPNHVLSEGPRWHNHRAPVEYRAP